MYPLTLRVQPGAWRLYTLRNANPAFKEFAEKIWRRDDYSCQFCGFQARDFQEVINLDHNYYNNKPANLVTSCAFCAQCHFLESVGLGDFGGGELIYLPEISQPELNSFCHVLFCAIANDTGFKATAQSIYRSLKDRAKVIDKKFSEGASQPSVFGQLLISSGLNEVEMQDVLREVRLLPSRGRFRKQIEHWAASALDALAAME